MRKVFLMDVVSANNDRHGYNLLVKKVGGKTQTIAIDHGFAFPGRPSTSFSFPVGTQAAKNAMLTLDAASVRALRELDTSELVGVMKKAGIQHEARTATLVRISAMRKDPGIIAKQLSDPDFLSAQPSRSPAATVARFIYKSHNKPLELVSAKELKALTEVAK
jgi:hypothetical protein